MNKKCKYCKYKEDLNGITGCFYMGADCKHGEMYEPFTNADRIRLMSDEKLSEYLAEIGSEANNGVIYSDRPEEWLEYLQQPAEEA